MAPHSDVFGTSQRGLLGAPRDLSLLSVRVGCVPEPDLPSRPPPAKSPPARIDSKRAMSGRPRVGLNS